MNQRQRHYLTYSSATCQGLNLGNPRSQAYDLPTRLLDMLLDSYTARQHGDCLVRSLPIRRRPGNPAWQFDESLNEAMPLHVRAWTRATSYQADAPAIQAIPTWFATYALRSNPVGRLLISCGKVHASHPTRKRLTEQWIDR